MIKNFSDDQWSLFTDELKSVLNHIETTLTYEHPVLSINKNYFLLSVFEVQECLAYKIIDALLSSTSFKLLYDAYFRLVTNSQITAIKPNRVIPFDDEFKKLIQNGITEMNKLNDEKLTSIHIILAAINNDNGYDNIVKIMKSAGLSYQLLKSRLIALKEETINVDLIENVEDVEDVKQTQNKKQKKTIYPEVEFELQGGVGMRNSKTNFIRNYCHDLNKRAKEGKVDPVIGRDKEIEIINSVFNRRKKNNVILVGEKGSGKTAICESLAWLIVNNKAPYTLQDKIILKLDIPSIIAGTTYRGMFEERIKGIFSEIQRNPNYILFIDDIHTFTNKQDNDSNTDITPYLKEAINNGNIKVITTCSPKGYHKKFDSDQSLANKFQRIDIRQLQDNEIKEILLQVKTIYEKYHNIELNEDVIDLCIFLCKRYISDREMPDSVIDIIDEIGSTVSRKYVEPEHIKELKTELQSLSVSKKDAIQKGNFDEVDVINEKENKKIQQLQKNKNKHNNDIVIITKEIVLNIFSEKTGIPVNNLSSDNKKDLSTLNERLKKVVIGQDDAIDKICRAIKRKKIGIHNGKSTVLFCHGTTGSGKTFLAKKLAEELFGSEKSMVRFDMSEYSDKTGVNKLIGSNPGYVGYEEGGLLTESIKNKKHCILLLDEFEKADSEIYNLFLQVFDEGFLTDNSGQKVDFRNVIILLTSNVGAREASLNKKTIGFTRVKEDDENKANSIVEKELRKRFAPEFLNRLDGIIHFNTLKDDDIKEIIRLEIDKSVKRFLEIGYHVTYNSNNAIEHIFNIVQDESEYGARPIIRAVQNEIEDPITDAILDGECNTNISIDFQNGKIIVDCSI